MRFVTDQTDLKIITSQTDLEQLRIDLGVRPDWHEPDEQEVSVEVEQVGEFDNAMVLPGVEIGVYVLQAGVRVAYVNLALLFSLANGHYKGL